MELVQAKNKIESWLFEDADNSVLSSIEQKYDVCIGIKKIEGISRVGVDSYEVLLNSVRRKSKISIIVFVQFSGDEITYYSVTIPAIVRRDIIHDSRLKLAEILYTIAFRLISEESAHFLFGYGCVVMSWLLTMWLVYCVAHS